MIKYSMNQISLKIKGLVIMQSPTVQDIDWGFTGSTSDEDCLFYVTRSQVAYFIYMIIMIGS